MVEFELVSGQEPPRNKFLDQLEKLFSSGGRPLSGWAAHPPFALALVILTAVAIELTIAKRMYYTLGAGLGLLTNIIATAITLFVIEAVMAEVAHYIASIFDKSGSRLNLFALMNLGLVPLLIFLPFSLLVWAAGGPAAPRTVLFLLLLVKVIHNWKDAIQATYKLTKPQLALVTAATVGLLLAVPTFVMILGALSAIGSMG